MKKSKWIIRVCLFVFFFSTVSCGYRFEGGGYLKETVKRVAVQVFKNQSTETGADLTFTNALIQEIIEKTDTRVVDEQSADTIIRGVVKSITFDTLSRSTTESVLERRVSATVDAQLVNKEGDIIWSVAGFAVKEDYTVSENQLTDDSNKKQAVEKIASRTAEKLVSKLLVNF
jgi:hypothetical protein